MTDPDTRSHKDKKIRNDRCAETIRRVDQRMACTLFVTRGWTPSATII